MKYITCAMHDWHANRSSIDMLIARHTTTTNSISHVSFIEVSFLSYMLHCKRCHKPECSPSDQISWLCSWGWVTYTPAFRHYSDVIMTMMASQITNLTFFCSIVYSGADQRKYYSSASLAFVRGIHRGPVNSPHKGPVSWEMFPIDDVIMIHVRQVNSSVSITRPQIFISYE